MSFRVAIVQRWRARWYACPTVGVWIRQVQVASCATRDTIATELDNRPKSTQSQKSQARLAHIRTFNQLVKVIDEEDGDENVFHVFSPKYPG